MAFRSGLLRTPSQTTHVYKDSLGNNWISINWFSAMWMILSWAVSNQSIHCSTFSQQMLFYAKVKEKGAEWKSGSRSMLFFLFFFFFTCKGSILLLHGDVRSLVLHHTCAAFTSHVSHLHSHENTEVIVWQKEQSRLTGLNRFFSASQHISECSELSAYLYVCTCVLIALVVPHCNAPMQRNENSSAGVTAPGRPQESNREVLSL